MRFIERPEPYATALCHLGMMRYGWAEADSASNPQALDSLLEATAFLPVHHPSWC